MNLFDRIFKKYGDRIEASEKKITSSENRLDDINQTLLQMQGSIEKIVERLNDNDAVMQSLLETQKLTYEIVERLNNDDLTTQSLLETQKLTDKLVERFNNNDITMQSLLKTQILTDKIVERLNNNDLTMQSLLKTQILTDKIVERLNDNDLTMQSLLKTQKMTDKIIDKLDLSGYLDTMDYTLFENTFRGPSDIIKEQQKIYLKYFKNCKCVYDLGCGRGEFVELLSENGINAIGVDFNQQFIDICHNKNLNAVYGDALETLKEAPEKIDGIFSSQMIEHISKSKLLELCRICYSKLPKGGYVIFETPNISSLITLANSFYLDPTHDKPVHPKLLEYFFNISGFSHTEIIFTEASRAGLPSIPFVGASVENSIGINKAIDHLNGLLFNSQDYAIVAIK